MGESNVNYQVVVNKVANEIVQCAINYFIKHRDSNEYDPGDKAMNLLKMAKAISPNGHIKTRVDENIVQVQEWNDVKAERDRTKKIKDDLEFIKIFLERSQGWVVSLVPFLQIKNSKELVVSCKPKLNNIKNILGSTDDFYLKISSVVVGNAQGMLISAVNNVQESFQTDVILNRILAFSNMKTVFESAMEVTTMLGSFDMTSELRFRYNSNKSTLQKILKQLEGSSNPKTNSESNASCYIATMAYGSYDHPQVLQLRKFRDETLATSAYGRKFITGYYKASPKLVELLKGKPIINSAIRTLLNTFISITK